MLHFASRAALTVAPLKWQGKNVPGLISLLWTSHQPVVFAYRPRPAHTHFVVVQSARKLTALVEMLMHEECRQMLN